MRDLTSLYEPNSFDVVLFMGNSFGYFDKRSDDLKTLRQIGRVLRPGGRLIADFLNGDVAIDAAFTYPKRVRNHDSLDVFLEIESRLFGGANFRIDKKRRRGYGFWKFIDARRRTTRIHEFSYAFNLYTPEEIRHKLNLAGLHAGTPWKRGSDGTVYDPAYTLMWTVVCEKA
jgi:D-alanine-D-alanine ligase